MAALGAAISLVRSRPATLVPERNDLERRSEGRLAQPRRNS
jgi:hypothetical protein